jgi:hypothetical protein
MPYDRSKDTTGYMKGEKWSYGNKTLPVTPSDTVDLASYPKAVVVITAGNLSVLPAQNADGATVLFTAAPVGFSPPFTVRRVLAALTTAAVVAVYD